MTPEQRRAHLILIGQPLLDEWLEYCRAWTKAVISPGISWSREEAVWLWRDAVEREYGDRRAGDWAGPHRDDFAMKNGDYYTYVVPDNLTGETK